MKTNLITVLLAATALATAASQVQAESIIRGATDGLDAFAPHVWEQHIRPARDTEVHSILPIAGGDILAVGVTRGQDTYADGWIAKLTSDGQIVWLRTLPHSQYQSLHDVAVDDFGTIYAVGSDVGPMGEIGWIVAYDLAGNELWDELYGGLGNDSIAAIAQSGTGMLFAGTLETEREGKAQGWLSEIDADGEIVWETTLPYEDPVWFSEFVTVSDGSIVAVGRTTDEHGRFLSIVTKFDEAREVIWTEVSEDGGGHTSVADLSNGLLVISGVTRQGTASVSRGVIEVLDGNGQSVWRDEVDDFEPFEVIAGPDGRVVAVGQGRDAGNGYAPRALMRTYTDQGDLESEIWLGSTMGSSLSSVAISAEGQIVAGGSNSIIDDGNGGHAWIIAGWQDDASQRGEIK